VRLQMERMLLRRFAFVSSVFLGVFSCTKSSTRLTPARAAPWVEFMRGEQLTGWMDTSRMAAGITGPVEVPLSIDYARMMRVTDDTTAKYSRMDWLVSLDCATGQLRDHGITLYDAGGREVRRWRPTVAEPWVPIQGHVSGTTVVWACRRLDQLRRQSSGASDS
jgi:hypothetical protein